MFQYFLLSYLGTFCALSTLVIFAVVCVAIVKRRQRKKLEKIQNEFSSLMSNNLRGGLDETEKDN